MVIVWGNFSHRREQTKTDTACNKICLYSVQKTKKTTILTEKKFRVEIALFHSICVFLNIIMRM